ncbi:unnamed protein product, partial [marine sediment metagenome]
HQRAEGADRNLFDALWHRRADIPADEVRRRFRALGVETEARRLMADYDQQAVRSLEPLTRADLKGLLRRVVFRIFHNLPQGTPDGDA